MEIKNTDTRLSDPLSEVTRKERRMLLGVSMLGIFFVKAGILPTKISALGVDLQSSDQNSFLYLMCLVLVYFMIAFFIYAMSDFVVWRKAVMNAEISSYKQEMEERDNYPQHPYDIEMEGVINKAYKSNRVWFALTRPVSISRAAFEFVLPLLFGLFAVAEMIFYASRNS